MKRSFDATFQPEAGALRRFVVVSDAPVLVDTWQSGRNEVSLRALALQDPRRPPALTEHLEEAIARVRFALGIDSDLSEFHQTFVGDRLLGPVIRRRPDLRSTRQAAAWDALAWAIVGQLIEFRRAEAIARAIVGRWGPEGPFGLRDVPSPKQMANLAPAELEGLGLAGKRAIAMRCVATEVERGRVDIDTGADDRRLARIPNIGPWTMQRTALFGRGDPDSLPVGDLDYLKIVGSLARLGRRAEVAEVEEFFEPYRPYRGLAGEYLRKGLRLGLVPGAG